MPASPFRLSVCAMATMLMIDACTTRAPEQGLAPTAQDADQAAQPETATYSCADGSLITIRNAGGSVHVTGAGDGIVDLPAAPPGQRSRYGLQPYALVLEGSEALFMKDGNEPLTCTR